MTIRWNFKQLDEEERDIQKHLASSLDVSPVLAKLLVDRGVHTYEAAEHFFRPDLADLHDPFLMADMDKAVERLTIAMRQNEKVLVYGDYDVDGTTSVAMVYKFLKQFVSRVGFYVPDRYTEGYGISLKGIDYAADNHYTLVVALDCGIKAVEKVKYAKERGVDFIICDHHTPDVVLPPAVAVLDPKRDDCHYPYKHLSGCGVGFKLLQALSEVNDLPFDDLLPLLDLVTLSIASDLVPLTGENRVLAYYGLKRLNSLPSVGVKGIIDVSGLDRKEITISDIVFKIGPRINASGRMKLASEVVELLVTQDREIARRMSETINGYNNNRKLLDKTITDEAIAQLEAEGKLQLRKSIVVYNPSWHKGVMGIVASRLSEEFHRPSIVLTKSNGVVSGSARSVGGFDLYAAVESCRDLLDNFGGHRYAAGLSIKEENIPLLVDRFEKYVSENILEEQTYPQINVDAELQFKDITPKFFRILQQFAPFGPGNMKPVFVTKGVIDCGASRLVGKELEHLKLEITDDTSEGAMSGIAFGLGRHVERFKSKARLDICYSLEGNTYGGVTAIQLTVRDIKEPV